MKQVISSEKKPIKLWLDDIEDRALDQAKNLANLPFVFRHIAIMPDAHEGYGMPIGGVIATKNVIIPNAVGVDIGCGMCAVRTSIMASTVPADALKRIMGSIRQAIPVGMKHHKDQQMEWLSDKEKGALWGWSVIEKQYKSSMNQIGTLGGGNHFIELQKGSDSRLWLMIHSGSRNIGFQVAKHYNALAVELNNRWFSSVPKEWQLAFLPMDSSHFSHYFEEMKTCVEFALCNRRLMMERVKEAVLGESPDTTFDEMINIAHNYAAMEQHFGENVMVHRKGATRARLDELGIIPGSQGTSSYIVRGLGNPESFESCSHGAGRVMGRKQAQRNLDLETEKKRLDDLGMIHGMRNKRDLDEAAGAYKDISVVMENQKDLVEIVLELSPLAVIKG